MLTSAQGTAIESGLCVDVRRTNRYLRFALFVFGTIVVWAAVGLSLLLFDVKRDWAIAWTAIPAGAIALALVADRPKRPVAASGGRRSLRAARKTAISIVADSRCAANR